MRAYYDAVRRHDVDGALAHLADGFEIDFGGGQAMDRRGAAAALGWDAGAGGSVEWEIVEATDRSIVVEGRERNEFLGLLGIHAVPFRSEFTFDDDGLIARQTYAAYWGDVSIPDALAPAIAWAKEEEPERLAQAYPDVRLVYSEASARRWVALLRRWRASLEATA